jgi:hypothetical protein
VKRLLAIIVVLSALLLPPATFAQSGYDLTAKVLSSTSDSTTTTYKRDGSIDCRSDNLGNTHCDETGGGTGTRQQHVMRQIVEMSDGNTYELVAYSGAGKRFAGGFAAANGGNTYEGRPVSPGVYQAKRDKHGFELAFTDAKGKVRKQSFYIISARPTDVGQKPK